ncbi:MAG: DUF3006 domain-containing protein [Spirochaetes bacterium]|nr:DUF3006 domain-containing protein [Spirochaetota bacterium]
MQAIVDRIEGKIAVLEIEGEALIECPKKFLPKGTKEGTILNVSFQIDKVKELQQKEKVKALQERMKKRR